MTPSFRLMAPLPHPVRASMGTLLILHGRMGAMGCWNLHGSLISLSTAPSSAVTSSAAWIQALSTGLGHVHVACMSYKEKPEAKAMCGLCAGWRPAAHSELPHRVSEP